MKTKTLSDASGRMRAARYAGVTIFATLLFSAPNLFAAANVSWLSGGPVAPGASPTGYGYVDGDITSSALYHTPCGLAIDPTGNYLFVADRDNNAVRFLEFDQNTTYTFGVVNTNLVNKPVGVALDNTTNVFVLNFGNGTNGSVVQFDNWGNTVATNLTRLTNAGGIAVDFNDNIYVTASNQVFKVTPAGVSNVVATLNYTNASLNGIVLKRSAPGAGMLAVCDSGRNGIYLIDPNTGNITTNSGFHGAGDFTSANNIAPGSTNKFFQPMGIAESGDGVLVVADYGNHRVKAVLANGTVTNLYGVTSNDWVYFNTPPWQWPGFVDGTVSVPDQPGGVAARQPNGVAIGPDGTIFVTEDYYHIIRTIVKGTTGIKPPLPAPPAAPVITSVTTNFGQVTLTWDPVVTATNYNVKRSTSPGAEVTIATTSSTSYTDTNVINGTTYYYVVSAINAGGEGPNSAEVSATVPIPPPPAPIVGWYDYEGNNQTGFFTKLHAVSGAPFVTHNDLLLAVNPTTNGVSTYYIAGPAPLAGIPGVTNGSTPPFYQDGLAYAQPLTVTTVPDLIIKAVNVNGVGLSSPVVTAEFLFQVASPTITGANAAQFTVSDTTSNTIFWYTIDGSDPTNASPSIGPIAASGVNPVTLSLNGNTNILFKVRGFRDGYQPSGVAAQSFSTNAFSPNTISFGFTSGEASSDFVASPGQFFYAPVTLTILPSTTIYSLQFNVTVTNLGTQAIIPGAFDFSSMLLKPNPDIPGLFITIPPYAFVTSGASTPPPEDTNLVIYNNNWFQDLEFKNTSVNLMGIGWLERAGQTNLYNTKAQTLLTYSQAHDILYPNSTYPGQVEVGGYVFLVPPTATSNDVYQIQIGRPTATSDGVGAPGSSVYIAAPTNGATGGGAPLNALKYVTIGQRKYIAGSVYPFRWFNAGDFGSSNIVNADVEQVFEAAVYGLNSPAFQAPGSDFFDAMDSCGNYGVLDTDPADPNDNYYTNTFTFPSPYVYQVTNYTYVIGTNGVFISTNQDVATQTSFVLLTTSYVNYTYTNTYIFQATPPASPTTNISLVTYRVNITPADGTLFSGDDTTINQIAFGDGILDVCDVYVTYRRSLDPTLTWFRRFWNNGQRVADTVPNIAPAGYVAKAGNQTQTKSSVAPQVNFTAGDIVGSAGQTIQVPVNASIFGGYPLRVLMLDLNVTPLDGSPALTTAVQFTPNSALGTPYTTDSLDNGDYSAVWLDNTIAGLTGTASIGTLTVTIPTNATSLSAYAVHFNHASASPNGLGSFPKQTFTGLITLSSRTNSTYNDSIPDSWRLRWFGTIHNLLSVSNACPSSDGINNWKKYVAGVDPNTPNDFPSLNSKSPVPSGSTAAIHWPTVSGKQYVILRSPSLFPGSWTAIATNTGTGTDMELDDTSTGQTKYYRVLILP